MTPRLTAQIAGALAAAALIFAPYAVAETHAGAPKPGPAAARTVAPAKLEKFALLIGIDNYKDVNKLEGCVNDVTEMKQTLVDIYKFADDGKHIKVLTNEKATRAAILSAFKEHLIANAKAHPNAVIVFQYSGHGSQTKDTNQDEQDGLDETFVAYDSRSTDYDLNDDVIGELCDELSEYTNNIVFIVDACHSGTATRAFGALKDGGAVRQVAMDERPQPPQPKNQHKPALEQSSEVLPRGKYVTFSGCLPNELSQEVILVMKDGTEKHHGRMTFHLLGAMRKLGPTASYRQLWELVDKEVTSETARQHPQVEGEIDRIAFNSPSAASDPYMTIEKLEGDVITVNGGKVHGFAPGGVLAIYKPETLRLSGTANLLGSATVVKVDDFSSQARLSSALSAANLKDAKVVVATRGFGNNPLRIAVSETTAEPPSTTQPRDEHRLSEARLLGQVATELQKNPILQVTNAGADPLQGKTDTWDIALVARVNPDNGRTPTSTPEVVSLLARDGSLIANVPVRGQQADDVDRIMQVLESRARQRSVLALSNATSPLNNSFKVVIFKMDGASGTDDFDHGNPVMLIGEKIKLLVKNNATRNLYFTILALGSSGSITVIHPPKGAQEPVTAGTQFSTRPIIIGGPPGTEAFKFIVTTKPTDFRFLEQGAVSLTRNLDTDESDESTVKSLLQQYAVGSTKRDLVYKETTLDDWAAETFQFNIREPVAAVQATNSKSTLEAKDK